MAVVAAASGSVALLGDTLHNAADALTAVPLAVAFILGRRQLGAGGVALGWDWADPVVGLLITGAILAVLRQAAREIYRRLMDAVDPALVDQAESTLRGVPGVLDVGQVRLRWIGHQIRAECEVVVKPDITAAQAHQVTVRAEHALLHAIPRLTAGLVHADPDANGTDHHHVLADHRLVPASSDQQ
jgi:divalent metal cation (Fe/Co/Zn/Cd) transporter